MGPTVHSIQASKRKFFALLAGLVLLLSMTGWLVVQMHGTRTQRDAYAHLTIIAKLKADQIEAWLDERYRDGHVLSVDPDFAQRAHRLLTAATPSADDQQAVAARFNQLRQAYDYDSMDLFDARGRVLVSTGLRAAGDQGLVVTAQAPRGGESATQVFVRVSASGAPELHWLHPIVAGSGGARRAIGYLMLKSSPEHALFPLIQNWPSSSPSGEVLLVTREGDQEIGRAHV